MHYTNPHFTYFTLSQASFSSLLDQLVRYPEEY